MTGPLPLVRCFGDSSQSVFPGLCFLMPLTSLLGVKVGCEAIVHSVAHILEKQDQPSLSRWVLLVDFSNAFNCVNV